MGEFPKINKRAVRNKHAGEASCKKIIKCAVRNKHAGETSCKKSSNVQDLIYVQ